MAKITKREAIIKALLARGAVDFSESRPYRLADWHVFGVSKRRAKDGTLVDIPPKFPGQRIFVLVHTKSNKAVRAFSGFVTGGGVVGGDEVEAARRVTVSASLPMARYTEKLAREGGWVSIKRVRGNGPAEWALDVKGADHDA
jgi:hypothetical protein